ncbi:ArsC family reductase [Endozoicomonas sp. ONNA1]|uniref:ArsC family reductase n=1 Tax=unclassified Endozoicomonas TaxID=2644528 RepID=UPI002148CDA3
MITLYGISNCDTIRKARKWLNAAGIEYRFHDYRKEGLDKVSLQNWSNELGWEALLNRRGTTWRQLPEAQKASVDEASAIELMLEQPAMIKRPLLDTGSKKVLGFSDKQYQALFQ